MTKHFAKEVFTCTVWISIAQTFLDEWFSILRYAAGLGNSKMKEEKPHSF